MSTTIAMRRAGVLGATLLLMAACGSSTSSQPSPAETAEGSPSPPSPPRSFQVTTPDGQASLALDGKLPPNWPSTFPVPPGAVPAGSGSLGGSASTGLVAVYSTATPPAQAFSYYTSNPVLTTSGARSVGVGDGYVGSMRMTAPYTGSVTVAARSDTTYIVVVLKQPGTSPSP